MDRTDILELSDHLWRGTLDIADHNPFGTVGSATQVADGTAFVPSFANVSAFATGVGLVLIDTGSPMLAAAARASLRTWAPDEPLHTAVYSHGHIDHVFGVDGFEAEARGRGWPAPRVVAHEALPARFDRYRLTAGYNGAINARQFRMPGLAWPTEYRYPDETYRDALTIEVGGTAFELRHAKGETDDATWTWVPSRGVLCSGDLFIWCSPNAGNPQKAQRYPREWALALREMASLGASTLLPGHGPPIVGVERIRVTLEQTAELLESLVEQTLALMNDGASLDRILSEVRAPAELMGRPWLRPIYDEPEFVVRNVWRLYGGWWDGNPARLKPPPDATLAEEVAWLSGGAAALASRAKGLADDGALRLACQLAEWAHDAAPDDPAVAAIRAEVYERRAAAETSLMSKGIFGWAAEDG